MATVLLLGAASDMATAIAKKFASKGYDIQLAARNCQRLEPLQSDLRIRYHVSSSVYEYDALKFETHQSFFDSLVPKPDVTICLVGYLGDQHLAQNNWDESKKTIDSNYTGPVSILNRAADYYEEKKAGCIACIASVAGERGRQSNYIYGSAKAGLVAYLSGLRNRLYKSKVHVATIQPGFVYTKMTENLKLPKILTANPSHVADAVYKAIRKKKNVVYVKWFWKWIMFLIVTIPESLFKKMKL